MNRISMQNKTGIHTNKNTRHLYFIVVKPFGKVSAHTHEPQTQIPYDSKIALVNGDSSGPGKIWLVPGLEKDK
jgi:hypothetical protein